MKIQEVKTNNSLIKIDNFFTKMWWDLFDIHLENQIQYYKKCDIYYFAENWEILSAIIYVKKDNFNYIRRFGTLSNHQWKWLWSKLLNYVLGKYSWDFHLTADKNKVEYYKKFWFIETWEKKLIWNEYAIKMIKVN